MSDQASTTTPRREIHSVYAPVIHDSAYKHVSGAALYVDDIPEPPGLLHCYIGPSKCAHGRIVSMDLSRVRQYPGVVKLLTALVTHAIFILLLILLITLYGLPFSLYWIQALYYLGAMALLGLGLSWITSAVNVFFRDTHQIVAVLLQFGFWATPIFWDPNIMPEQIQFLLKLNPLYYIVEGYRGSFIYSEPFWENLRLTAYFWAFTGLAFSSGVLVFRRLRPHFSDII